MFGRLRSRHQSRDLVTSPGLRIRHFNWSPFEAEGQNVYFGKESLISVSFFRRIHKRIAFLATDEMDDLHEEKYIAVVAIDFGTSFSGFAFAFNHPDGESGIHMNKTWGNEVGHPTYKTPTCLLLKPDLTFDRFGYEAQEKYAHLEDANEQKSFYYFEKFKMVLHGSKVGVLSYHFWILAIL